MSIPGPLRDSLSRYRKKKHLSLDARVPGVGAMRYRRSYNRAPAGLQGYAHGRLANAEEYDPVESVGYPTAPGYEPPDFADCHDCLGTTPPERFWLPNETAGIHEKPVSYDAMLITNAIIDGIRQDWQEMHDRATGLPQQTHPDPESSLQILDSMSPSSPVSGEHDEHDLTQELFDELMEAAVDQPLGLGTQPQESSPTEALDHDPFAIAEAQFDQAMEMLAGLEPSEMNAGDAIDAPLEQIVEQHGPVPPDKRHLDPFGAAAAMFDQQMQMQMDPFMMMGPMG